MGKPLHVDESSLEQITALLNGMEYGSVQITVHDGKIVQIERTERKRFENKTHLPQTKCEQSPPNA